MLKEKESKRWLWSLALLIPIFFFYFSHFYTPSKLGIYATGFIQYDQLGYMAFARQHFDEGFHLFYNNPFSVNANAPHLYFQPHIFLLGILQQILPFSPGTIYLLFGFVCALIGMRIVTALYEKVVGLDSGIKMLGLTLFVWGGGVLSLVGFSQNILEGLPLAQAVKEMFDYEPAKGWWLLNLGRNFLFPTEAYYHALFLGSILLVLHGKLRWAAGTAALLSISQPFTGIQLLLIYLVWSFLEITFLRRQTVSLKFTLFIGCFFVAHLLYYVFFLNLFEEHRAIYDQWQLDWLLQARIFIPAYLLVGIFAYWSMRNLHFAKSFLKKYQNRLFLIGFLVSFALANHEFAIEPHQPIHFARGYIYSFLFLMGAEPLLKFLNYLYSKTIEYRIALVCFAALFLSDNFAWFLSNTIPAFHLSSTNSYAVHGIWLLPPEKELMDWLAERPSNGEVLLCEDDRMTYYATAYTPYRSWKAHTYTSPKLDQRTDELIDFFIKGKAAPEMKDKSLIVIFLTHRPEPFEKTLEHMSLYNKVFQNNRFTAFEVLP